MEKIGLILRITSPEETLFLLNSGMAEKRATGRNEQYGRRNLIVRAPAFRSILLYCESMLISPFLHSRSAGWIRITDSLD